MNPQTLLFYLSPKSAYRKVLISEKEVFCSPDEEGDSEFQGDRTLQCPKGEFDISETLDRLAASEYPELLVVKLDATRRMIPRGIDQLKCPKVLVLGDSHHLPGPIEFLLDYARKERFDFLLSDHDRHHLHFFKRAGFRNVHWIPALNYLLNKREVAPAKHNSALFIGQLEEHHLYRRELFHALRDSGIPIAIGKVAPDETADYYASHAVSLNCSLNGDLNLRVFEIMGSGGLLLTDRISSDSGLYDLLEVGREFDVYGSLAELREKIRYYLERPDEVLAMRQRGLNRVLSEHTPEIKRRQLMDLVFNGREDPVLKLDDSRFLSLASFPKSELDSDVSLYQKIQDIHRGAQAVIIYGSDSAKRRLAFLGDLRRLSWGELEGSKEDFDDSNPLGLQIHRVLAISSDDLADSRLMSEHTGEWIIVLHSDKQAAEGMDRLCELGYEAVEEGSPLFRLAQPILAFGRWIEAGKLKPVVSLMKTMNVHQLPYDILLQLSNLALNMHQSGFAKQCLHEALTRDRMSIECYLSLYQIEEKTGNRKSACEYLVEAGRLHRLDDELSAKRDALFDSLEQYELDASKYLKTAASSANCFYRLVNPSVEIVRLAYLARSDARPDEALLAALSQLSNAGLLMRIQLGVMSPESEVTRSMIAEIERLRLDAKTEAWAIDSDAALAALFARSNVYFASAIKETDLRYETLMAQLSGVATLVDRDLAANLDLKDGHNCVYCSRGNVNEIARAIAALAASQKVWNDIIEQGKEFALNQTMKESLGEFRRKALASIE